MKPPVGIGEAPGRDPWKRGKVRSLKRLMLTGSGLFAFFAALVFGLALVRSSWSMLLEKTDARLHAAAEFLYELLGPTYHDRIEGAESVSAETFRRSLDRNDDLCRRLDLQYLWSVLVLEDRIVFTSATRSDVDDPASAHASFFETHDDPHSFDGALGKPGSPVFSSFKNRWGEGRQVLVPRIDARGRRYILGASVRLSELNRLALDAAATALVAATALFGLLWLILGGLLRRFSVILSGISAAAGRMAEGRLDAALPSSGIDELRRLCGALDTMRANLKYRMETLSRSADALRESEAKWSALFGSMAEMVVLHELVFDEAGTPVDYRILDCNPAFTRLTGIRRENALGRLATEVYGTPEPPYLSKYAAVALSGAPQRYQTWFPPMDKHFDISVVSPGRNRFATVTSDISEARRIQAALDAKNKELEQIVYVASHDLRSPLVNVDGFSRELEISLRELETLLGGGKGAETLESTLRAELPEMGKSIDRIRASTRQMDSLLKGLLKLSRSGRAALQIADVDMDGLIGQVVSSFAFRLKEADVDLAVESLPACRGDAVQLTQVFSNLLDNAVKYGDPGRPGRIRIRGGIEKDRAVYRVEDNGIGIAENHLGHVFELFHRLDPGKTAGEGLGLTIARQALGRMEGEIRVESKPGEGSTFIVVLPQALAGKTG